MYTVTKTYDHSEGLSCVFRQWRADSHCNMLHGYALAIELVFEADTLDSRNWVIDFGGFKDIRRELHYWFDHTTLVASDDPRMTEFNALNLIGLINLRIIPAVGAEKFAEFIFNLIADLLNRQNGSHAILKSVKVSEHGANAATYSKIR